MSVDIIQWYHNEFNVKYFKFREIAHAELIGTLPRFAVLDSAKHKFLFVRPLYALMLIVPEFKLSYIIAHYFIRHFFIKKSNFLFVCQWFLYSICILTLW